MESLPSNSPDTTVRTINSTTSENPLNPNETQRTTFFYGLCEWIQYTTNGALAFWLIESMISNRNTDPMPQRTTFLYSLAISSLGALGPAICHIALLEKYKRQPHVSSNASCHLAKQIFSVLDWLYHASEDLSPFALIFLKINGLNHHTLERIIFAVTLSLICLASSYADSRTCRHALIINRHSTPMINHKSDCFTYLSLIISTLSAPIGTMTLIGDMIDTAIHIHVNETILGYSLYAFSLGCGIGALCAVSQTSFEYMINTQGQHHDLPEKGGENKYLTLFHKAYYIPLSLLYTGYLFEFSGQISFLCNDVFTQEMTSVTYILCILLSMVFATLPAQAEFEKAQSALTIWINRHQETSEKLLSNNTT